MEQIHVLLCTVGVGLSFSTSPMLSRTTNTLSNSTSIVEKMMKFHRGKAKWTFNVLTKCKQYLLSQNVTPTHDVTNQYDTYFYSAYTCMQCMLISNVQIHYVGMIHGSPMLGLRLKSSYFFFLIHNPRKSFCIVVQIHFEGRWAIMLLKDWIFTTFAFQQSVLYQFTEMPTHSFLDMPYTLMLDSLSITLALTVTQQSHGFGITIANDTCVM